MNRVKPTNTGRPVTLAKNGMIATPHYLATSAGVEALARGGSAVDAIIEANAVLCVVYPHMAGLGGDAFWLISDGRGGGVEALNGSGRAAAAATIDFYRDRGLEAIPARGALAANTVPGAVDSWHTAHRRHGKLEWGSLFERAIQYAQDGVPVPRSTAKWIAKDIDVLLEHDLAGDTFLKHGIVYEEGEVIVQRGLARSFKEIASGGREAFYEGPIAREIVRYLRSEGGLLSEEDFAEHYSDWVDPIHTIYRGHGVYTFPPNTQGLSVLLILKMLEDFDLHSMGDGSADYLHHVVEATKLAFADRDRWVSDPEFIGIPTDALLSDDYSDNRRREIDPRWARPVDLVLPGDPGTLPGAAEPWLVQAIGGDTIYMSAVDRDGTSVSFIQSIYHDFGSAMVGGDTGIIMQNRGSFFSLDPAHPNHLEPRKRTFHTLMPSMVIKEGQPYLVFGTMGGEGQPQTQTAMVNRLVDFGYDVQEAIEAPRWLWGRAWGDEDRTLKLEGRFPRDVVEELEKRGHPVEVLGDWEDTMGHASQILIDPETGVLHGAADPRGDGAAMGW